MTTNERIPFQVEVQRVIEVLATQIYQSPMALLRENTQNSFDAIMLRRHRGDTFEPRIELEISSGRIIVRDNGIGMSPDDLRQHYWSAGSSSKNNDDARAAGVVGTFGIGAMANFGVADVISVETESAITGERTRSVAQRATLSLTEDCIELVPLPPTGTPGTTVTAEMAATSPIDVGAAINYIREFVSYVTVPVVVNDQLLSQNDLRDSVGPGSAGWSGEFPNSKLGDLLGSVTVNVAAGTGEVSVDVDGLRLGDGLPGRLVLRQGMNRIRSYRSGFGLAVFSLSSAYQFGGAVDLAVLEPTAGREALSTGSMQLLQNAMAAIDDLVSTTIAGRNESDLNTNFMAWVASRGRYELCDNLTIRVEPNRPRLRLADARSASLVAPLRVYPGNESTLIDALASEDAPLYVLAASNPRKQCEVEFLRQYCQAEYLDDTPTLLSVREPRTWTLPEQALVFRIVSILQSDYFLPSVDVQLAELSHGLPVLLSNAERTTLYLDPRGSTFGVLISLYSSDYSGFGSMVKDFVRTIVFPQVSSLVPSSSRQGAQAFLNSIRRTRDTFEYEYDDLDDFKSIWSDLLAGRLTLGEAADKATSSVTRSSQIFDATSAMSVRDVMPDVITNEEVLSSAESASDLEAFPAIMRREIDTDAKLLTIAAGDTSLRGHRCFVSLSDKTREDRGDFFLQPHRTSIVWGGQRVLFVFEHHSGAFGLYYDLQASEPVAASSGGGPFPTSTIILGNRIFIPVPDELAPAFIPGPSERKRFGVRADLTFAGSDERSDSVAM